MRQLKASGRIQARARQHATCLPAFRLLPKHTSSLQLSHVPPWGSPPHGSGARSYTCSPTALLEHVTQPPHALNPFTYRAPHMPHPVYFILFSISQGQMASVRVTLISGEELRGEYKCSPLWELILLQGYQN